MVSISLKQDEPLTRQEKIGHSWEGQQAPQFTKKG